MLEGIVLPGNVQQHLERAQVRDAQVSNLMMGLSTGVYTELVGRFAIKDSHVRSVDVSDLDKMASVSILASQVFLGRFGVSVQVREKQQGKSGELPTDKA
jgi:hypothetical protein